MDLERAAWLSLVNLEENIPQLTSVQSSINVDIEVICLLGLKEFCGKPRYEVWNCVCGVGNR